MFFLTLLFLFKTDIMVNGGAAADAQQFPPHAGNGGGHGSSSGGNGSGAAGLNNGSVGQGPSSSRQLDNGSLGPLQDVPGSHHQQQQHCRSGNIDLTGKYCMQKEGTYDQNIQFV